jgi:hypothetical protein
VNVGVESANVAHGEFMKLTKNRRLKEETFNAFGWDETTDIADKVHDLAEIIARTAPAVMLREMQRRCPKCRCDKELIVTTKGKIKTITCDKCEGTGLSEVNKSSFK